MRSIGIITTLLFASPVLADDWGKADEPAVCDHAVTQNQIHYNAKCQAAIDKMVDPGCINDPAMKDALAKAGYVDGQNTSKLRRDKGKKLPQDARDICETEALKRIQKQSADAEIDKTEMPKSKGQSATIEKMIRDEIKANWRDGEQLLKIVFDSGTEWTVNRNGLGIIISRSIAATAAYKKDDKCTLYSTYWVQQYNGKAFAGSLEEHGGGGAQTKGIRCEKVK
jgi:hypothetical protein